MQMLITIMGVVLFLGALTTLQLRKAKETKSYHKINVERRIKTLVKRKKKKQKKVSPQMNHEDKQIKMHTKALEIDENNSERKVFNQAVESNRYKKPKEHTEKINDAATQKLIKELNESLKLLQANDQLLNRILDDE